MPAVAPVQATAAPLLVAAPAPAPQAGCPSRQAPPPPAAEEERTGPAVEPLAWPDEPVGGEQLGTCDTVGPSGAPDVTAQGWVLADLDSGAVIAARAPHARHRPASTLKILTALVAIRRLDPNAVVEGTAQDQAIDGSKAGIGPGGQYTVRQLLAGLLLNSGNDTAEALARAAGGDAAMLTAMTETAQELGALDTRPATPSGLDGPGMASSAYDLALLFRVAMREPIFAQTIRTRSVDFPGYGDRPGFVLYNSSKVLARYEGALGGKTGYTVAARHTLVAAAARDGRRLVVALVRGEQSPEPMWRQGTALLDWGFAQPAGQPAVGQLVDARPVPPPPPVAAAASAPTPATTPTAAEQALMPIALGGVAIAAIIVGWAALRRRPRRR
ncbi:hypothetical protein BJF78_34630 [Pseudonocardia sp. CNS-139]|nr:hypothetical protein BJF78_34630 [Pseudonocardia sp. CNS-139]